MACKIYPILFLFIVFQCSAQGLWLQKATCPNSNNGSVSFVINGIVYQYSGTATNNFFAYNPNTDIWSSKADFPGGLRHEAAGFAIDSFGYLGTGAPANWVEQNDFYQYNPSTDSWTARANYPDSVSGAFCFSINGMGYFAGGHKVYNDSVSKRCFAYNPATNTWTVKDTMPVALAYGVSAVVNGKAYCGLGVATCCNHLAGFYEYDPVANTWSSKASYLLKNSNYYSSVYSFVVNDKIYVGDPRQTTVYHGTLAVYSPATNDWDTTQVFPYPSLSNCDPLNLYCGVTVNNRGFIGGINTCTGTTFWEFDPNNSFQVTSLTVDTVCEGQDITVSFSSTLNFDSGNTFKIQVSGLAPYGNNNAFSTPVAGNSAGTYTFTVPAFLNNGSAALSEYFLYSTSPPYQSSGKGFVYVKKAPAYGSFTPLVYGCAGSAILLYRQNNTSVSHVWSSNPSGLSSTASALSYVPTQNVTLYVTDTYNITGCVLSDSIHIVYTPLPSLNIADSSYHICPGNSVTLGGTATANGSYVWSGGGLNSTTVNPVVSPSADTSYHLVLTDTITQCVTSGNTIVTIHVAPMQDVCFVTVDTASTHNVVVWEKPDKFGTDSFYVFREVSTNVYSQVGAIHRDSLSEYHDYAANPNITGYRYKIGTRDTCGNVGVLSAYHNTIHLQYLGSGNLIWNVYEIENSTTPVNTFDVMYDPLANGNWQLLVNVPGTQSTTTDINYANHPGALYRIAANWAYTCTSSRSSQQVLSNVLQIGGTGTADLAWPNSLHLFPNPASNVLMINSDALTVESMKIMGADGKTLFEIMLQGKTTVDISSLPAGVYVAQIKTNTGTAVKRVTKL